jgi:hypothetical protein
MALNVNFDVRNWSRTSAFPIQIKISYEFGNLNGWFVIRLQFYNLIISIGNKMPERKCLTFYSLVVIICTATFNNPKLYFLPTQCIYAFYISQNKQRIHWQVFTTEIKSVYCAVPIGYLSKTHYVSSLNVKKLSQGTISLYTQPSSISKFSLSK